MSISSRLAERAIALSKAGRKAEARTVLKEVIRREPRHETAWLWYVDTFSGREERIVALQQLLRVLPNHPLATKALVALERSAPTEKPASPRHSDTTRVFNVIAGIILIVGLCAILVGAGGLFNAGRYRLQISNLESDNSNLQAQIVNLTGQVNSLSLEFQNLLTAHQALEDEYEELRQIALFPPYISVTNRQMVIGFLKTDQTQYRWEIGFDALEAELQRGNRARESLQYDQTMWVELDNPGLGEVYTVVDMTYFIDPSSFRDVIPALYAEAGSDDAFIYEVWNIVTQLATYSADLEETPRYPLETFLAGGGDCEDTAILFASMILAAPVQWDVELVYMDLDHPNKPQDVNHVAVLIDTGSREYLVETTEGAVMEPHGYGVIGWHFRVP